MRVRGCYKDGQDKTALGKFHVRTLGFVYADTYGHPLQKNRLKVLYILTLNNYKLLIADAATFRAVNSVAAAFFRM